jgi:hypothetical protein
LTPDILNEPRSQEAGMNRFGLFAVLTGFSLLLCGFAEAKATQDGEYRWSSVDRVVAIGDIHGDFEQYMKVLRSADLVDKRGRWSGGKTHMVQTGDIPDRGADTLKIIEHIQALKKQAARKGGHVHTLIGNHEAMNVYGDLRYVHPGEFAAFVNRDSKRLREQQWDHYLKLLEQKNTAEELALVDMGSLRKKWETVRPLGWVEHRINWITSGDIGAWVVDNPAIVMVNDSLFLHGGLSAKYCRKDIGEINAMVTDALLNFNPEDSGILEDQEGPLWYRGLARDDESKLDFTVRQILKRYGAKRIVVGHTPTHGVVWPRFEGRVIVNDVGMANHYGAHEAYLELSGGKAIAGYGEHRLQIPTATHDRIPYLKTVIEWEENDEYLQRLLQKLLTPAMMHVLPEDQAAVIETAETADMDAVSSGICQ